MLEMPKCSMAETMPRWVGNDAICMMSSTFQLGICTVLVGSKDVFLVIIVPHADRASAGHD